MTSLGYCKLLMLSSRDFHALLARDEHLRERIQVVAKQRLRAIEVWKQFSQASQAEAAATPVAAPVPAPSAAAPPKPPRRRARSGARKRRRKSRRRTRQRT